MLYLFSQCHIMTAIITWCMLFPFYLHALVCEMYIDCVFVCFVHFFVVPLYIKPHVLLEFIIPQWPCQYFLLLKNRSVQFWMCSLMHPTISNHIFLYLGSNKDVYCPVPKILNSWKSTEILSIPVGFDYLFQLDSVQGLSAKKLPTWFQRLNNLF